MGCFFDEQRIKELQKEMLSTGTKVNFSKWTFPNLGQIGNLPYSAYINDAKTLNHLALNKHAVKANDLESAKEFENRDLLYAEEWIQSRNPTISIKWAYKAASEIEQTLSQGKMMLFSSNSIVDKNGFCIVCPAIKMPLFEGKKIVAVFTSYFESTKTEYVENLYSRYKAIYADDMQKGNRLFMEYLGLPVCEFVLTTRQIEVLISLAKNHTHKDASRELDIAGGTLATYLQSIKRRLHNQNMNDILQHFMTNNRRIF